MLNIGQVVYDYTNERVIIFAGLEMLQSEKTGKCHTETGFILKDGTCLYYDGNNKSDFGYTNFTRDGRPVVGSFVTKCGLNGNYFGVISENALSDKERTWAKEAIEEVEALVAEHGLNTTEHDSHNGKYNRYHIGEPMDYKAKMSIDVIPK